MEPILIDLSTFRDLATADIGAFSPKPTSIEGDQVEAVRSFFQSPDGT
ncbi:MAG: cupin, partial [Mesorhizobium sp.]